MALVDKYANSKVHKKKPKKKPRVVRVVKPEKRG